MSNIVTGNIPKIGIAILSLIVIGSLVFGPFTGTLEIVSTDLQRILFGATYAEAAINSAKATAYAASCTGLMNLGSGDVHPNITAAWNGPVSPDMPDRTCAETNESDEATFGQVSVECDPLTERGSCRIYGYELPQEPIDTGWGTWIAGMGHPEYLMYYEAFPHGPESAWEVHGERLGAIAVASGAVLNLAFYGAAGRIASKADDLRSGVRSFLSSSDEGSSMMSRMRKVTNALPLWRQHSPATADAARSVIASDIAMGVQRLSSGTLDDVANPNLRQASENLYQYFQRNSIRDENLLAVRDEVKDRMRGHVDPGQVAGMTADEFDDVAYSIAYTLQRADRVRAGTARVAGGEVAEWPSMRQYWLQVKATDDIVDGLFDASRSASQSKMSSLVSQARDQAEDFVRLPDFALRDLTKDDIKRRAMYLMCRSRIPRIVAADGAEAYFEGNEDAQAVADALYVGSLTVDNICPGTSLGGQRGTMRGWSSTAIKGFAGVAIAASWQAQKHLSDKQKFTPQGINTIVVKIPYVAPQTFRMHNYTNYYYMNLQRTDVFQSNNKGFYLVSPFTTRNVDNDNPRIEIAKTNIECQKGSGGENTKRVYTQPDWNNGNNDEGDRDFPGSDWDNYIHVQNPVDPNQPDSLSDDIVSAAGNGIKKCTPSGWVDDLKFWEDNTYNTDTLEFRIKDVSWTKSDGSHNYGYDSTDLDGAGAKLAVVLLGLGLEFVSGPVPTTVILAGTGAAEVVIFEGIDRANAWPEH